ncbi:MAG: hypothetical protein ABIB71_03280, partial [Candidatus Woesearchaeota archaeon]
NHVLKPEEINAFLQYTTIFEEYRHYRKNTGPTISKLIQNSYDSGHNNFVIEITTPQGLQFLASEISGKEKPLAVTVTGHAGFCLGYKAENAVFNILGDAGERCGCMARNSVFRTPHRQNLEEINNSLVTNYKNELYLLHEGGKEEQIWQG